jgi:hypothetical protein
MQVEQGEADARGRRELFERLVEGTHGNGLSEPEAHGEDEAQGLPHELVVVGDNGNPRLLIHSSKHAMPS